MKSKQRLTMEHNRRACVLVAMRASVVGGRAEFGVLESRGRASHRVGKGAPEGVRNRGVYGRDLWDVGSHKDRDVRKAGAAMTCMAITSRTFAQGIAALKRVRDLMTQET